MTDDPQKFAELVAKLSQFNAQQLDAVEVAMLGIEGPEGRTKRVQSGTKLPHSIAVQGNQSGTKLPRSIAVQGNQSGTGLPRSIDSKDWPRAPVHRLNGKGAYIVTSGTLHKLHHFRTAEALDFLERELLRKAKEYEWHLEAWAVFSNHYHFVGQALNDPESLSPMLNHLHSDTARWINERDDEIDRQVWYNFWETKLTYSKSYQARLHYVHQNAVHHGLVLVPNQYPWCSAAWFERTATPAQVKTIYSFKTDRLKVIDDFEPVLD